MHNRLYPRRSFFLEAFLVVAAVSGIGLLAACDTATGPLASYQGARALEFLQVTQGAHPEIQWVGGRVAAVGVNKGADAALDSTLVWLMTSTANDIASFVRVGLDGLDLDGVGALGGLSMDSLESDVEYTFWLAEREALDASLAATPDGSFADTTLTLSYLLRGRSGGDPSLGVSFRVVREQTLVSDGHTIHWTPATQQFRRLAIRHATLGGFDKLKWHILVPEGSQASITTPIVIGRLPDGLVEATAWPDAGFETGAHTIWAVTDDWTDGEFSVRSTGYAYFQIFSLNFP